MSREKLKKQIADSAGNVCYTYSAHWHIVNRLKKSLKFFQIVQIILTAVSTAGFLTLAISNNLWLSLAGASSSAISLAINLYLLNFNMIESIKAHTAAANELWEVREAYKSLLVDFDELDSTQIRTQRDFLKERVSKINKKYPETDNESFFQAQKDMGKYVFTDGEAAQLFHIDTKN